MSSDLNQKIAVRRATREDINSFYAGILKPTMIGWVAELDGDLLALGGFAIVRGRYIAAMDFTKRGRKMLNRNVYVQAQLVRTVVNALKDAREQGIKFIYADAAIDEHPKAKEFLERFGFHIDPRSKAFYRWKNT